MATHGCQDDGIFRFGFGLFPARRRFCLFRGIRLLVPVDQRHGRDEPFPSAAGAAIVEFELGPGADHIADMGHLGCLDHMRRREFDALADIQPEPSVGVLRPS